MSTLPGTIKFVQVENNKIYATCFAAESDIFISSSDLGKMWQISDLGISIYENGFLYLNENNGFVSGLDGLYRSEDYGLNWFKDTVLVNYLEKYVGYPPTSVLLTGISFKDDYIYLGQFVPANWDGHIKGIITSADDGKNWYRPISNTPYGIWKLTCTESNIVASNLGWIYYSSDDCETWIEATGEFDYPEQI